MKGTMKAKRRPKILNFGSKKKLKLKRCLVPEGAFMMGTRGETFDESPAHRVYVSAFEMAQTPVINADYGLFLRENKDVDPPQWWEDPDFNDPQQPVVGVNWHEAKEYCAWLGRKVGMNMRLPSEAEFEKAARAGLQGKEYPWGNDVAKSGFTLTEGPLKGPYKPRATPANSYGLFDMVSNVYQWCLDRYDPIYYSESEERNPMGSHRSGQRAARGGSWNRDNLINRCAARCSLAPYFRCNDFSFRWISSFKVDV